MREGAEDDVELFAQVAEMAEVVTDSSVDVEASTEWSRKKVGEAWVNDGVDEEGDGTPVRILKALTERSDRRAPSVPTLFQSFQSMLGRWPPNSTLLLTPVS